MRQTKWVIVLRSIIAALVLVLGIASLAAGRIVIGIVLIGLAATNVALTITMRRRRAELLERFPGLAQTPAARQTGPTPPR
jgi:pilus assembly protein TadC